MTEDPRVPAKWQRDFAAFVEGEDAVAPEFLAFLEAGGPCMRAVEDEADRQMQVLRRVAESRSS